MSTFAPVLSPSTHISHKRTSEPDSDPDEDYKSTCTVKSSHSDRTQCKRFKDLNGAYTFEDSCFDSSIDIQLSVSTNTELRNAVRFQESSKRFLSPISELSMNLTGSSSIADADRVLQGDITPIKQLTTSLGSVSLQKINHDFKVSDTSQRTTKDYCIDDKLGDESFQIQRTNRIPLTRRVNMDSSFHDMAMDELSFYDDDHVSDDRQFDDNPQLMGLLSPEGSPQRFQIVEKTSNKLLQDRRPLTLKSLNNISDTNTSSNTPLSKGLRAFQSSSSSGIESSMDDEYMEFFDIDDVEQQSCDKNFPSDLSSLISGHIIKNSPVKTPEMRRPSVRRCLSMTENTMQAQPRTPDHISSVINNNISATRLNGLCCFKRPEPPSTSCSPNQSKRYRCVEKENLDGSFTVTSSSPATSSVPSTSRTILRKSMSMNDAEIMSALNRCDNRDEPDLIGDFTKPYILPLVEGRHRDLKSISCDTVSRLLNGEFDDEVANYIIIDCRYPYEYEGGHIKGAKNLYTQEQIIEEFLTQQKTDQQQAQNEKSANKRNIIIFHCEFSSERGPKLSRFLRNHDRARNTNSYPALDYPEVYLLHNGYKEFFETHLELCSPHAYRPMLEPSFNDEYRTFRAKTKSWNGDGLGGATQRLKKSRSRLML